MANSNCSAGFDNLRNHNTFAKNSFTKANMPQATCVDYTYYNAFMLSLWWFSWHDRMKPKLTIFMGQLRMRSKIYRHVVKCA